MQFRGSSLMLLAVSLLALTAAATAARASIRGEKLSKGGNDWPWFSQDSSFAAFNVDVRVQKGAAAATAPLQQQQQQQQPDQKASDMHLHTDLLDKLKHDLQNTPATQPEQQQQQQLGADQNRDQQFQTDWLGKLKDNLQTAPATQPEQQQPSAGADQNSGLPIPTKQTPTDWLDKLRDSLQNDPGTQPKQQVHEQQPEIKQPEVLQSPQLPQRSRIRAGERAGPCSNEDGTYKRQGTVCSPPHHPCDQPELCTGYSAECPADTGVTKSDGAACDWLPTNNPTWGKYMSDASNLKRSAVSFEAAAALMIMPPTASTQEYSSSGTSTESQGLSQCKGRCSMGLCSVDHSILHCCIAKEHYLKKRREEDAYDNYHDPDYAPETRYEGQKRFQEYYYDPTSDPHVAAGADRAQSKQRGPQLQATTSGSIRSFFDEHLPVGNFNAADEAREYMRKETEERQFEQQFQRTLVDELLHEDQGNSHDRAGGENAYCWQ